MSAEWLTAAASAVTMIVIAVTAYAALRQIRHMRSGNQVAALLPLIAEYQRPEMQQSLNYVLETLAKDLEDPAVRAGVVSVPARGPSREAMRVLNFYESVGALVCARVLDLELILRYFTLPSDLWTLTVDYIALTRRSRGPEIFENLEAMVALELAYAKRHGTSRFPKHLARLDVPDRYLASDLAYPS